MEVFNVVTNEDNKIILASEKQMESLFELMKAEEIVMIKWEEEAEDEDGDDVTLKRSRILPTEGLMARIKDGRFIIESREDLDN